MIFESFEGYKKIKNTMKLDTKQTFELLVKYEKEIGSIVISEDMEDTIFIHLNNKCFVDLHIERENIIIERRIEKGEINACEDSEEKGKDLVVAQADRMIEQIYDLLNDYIENNGTVSEHVTSTKKVLYMEEGERLVLGGVFSLGNCFSIKDENGKKVYEAKQNDFNKIYILRNCENQMEEFSVNYEKADENHFSIVKPPFDKIDIFQDKDSVKTVFKGSSLKQKLEISADYTDNHYLIEENEIVIGAIDCLDPLIKNKYKIEINDLKKEALILIIGIMLDIYNFRNNNELDIK